MGKRGFFAILIIATLISLAVFFIIFYLVNPYTTTWITILVFYSDLIILLTSVLTIIIFYFRSNALSGQTNQLPFSQSLRQGFLISIVGIGLLLLKAGRILNLWDGILLIIVVILIEFYYKK